MNDHKPLRTFEDLNQYGKLSGLVQKASYTFSSDYIVNKSVKVTLSISRFNCRLRTIVVRKNKNLAQEF